MEGLRLGNSTGEAKGELVMMLPNFRTPEVETGQICDALYGHYSTAGVLILIKWRQIALNTQNHRFWRWMGETKADTGAIAWLDQLSDNTL